MNDKKRREFEALTAKIVAAKRRLGTTAKVSAELQIAVTTVRRHLRMAAGPVAAPTVKGRSLSDFRAEHDKDFIVPKKIKEALRALGSGWEYEVQFSRMAGVSLGDLSAYRDAFDAHVVVVQRGGKRAWAGTVAAASEMRKMVSV